MPENVLHFCNSKYSISVVYKSTRHTVYDIKYHFVWVPKYRKSILKDKVEIRIKEIFREIADECEFEIDTMEFGKDYVHIFMSCPPKYSPAEIVNVMKGVSSNKVFKEFPELKEELWGGELWSDGYFVRTVGDKVTSDVIRRYIKYHKHKETQLKIF